MPHGNTTPCPLGKIEVEAPKKAAGDALDEEVGDGDEGFEVVEVKEVEGGEDRNGNGNGRVRVGNLGWGSEG